MRVFPAMDSMTIALLLALTFVVGVIAVAATVF
jgi:hypothetical protein